MLKILLADDSNVAQRMGKEILSAEGYEVLTVSNGQAALKKLPEFLPDLIIADVFMPGTGGYDLCKFVKSDKNPRHVPVILLVGAMEPYDPDEGRRVKADGVVTKPLQSTSLVKIVKSLLASVTPAAPPPAPKKAKASKAAAPEVDEREIETAKAPSGEVAEEPAQEFAVQKIEIPTEMADQPMAGFGELLEPASPPAAPAEPVVVTGSAAPDAAVVLPIETAPEATSNEPAIAFPASAPEEEPAGAPEKIEYPVASADAGDEPSSSSIFPKFPGEAQERESAPAPQEVMQVEYVTTELAGTASVLAEVPALVKASAPAEAAAPPESRWIVEPVEVTEEERKLFDEPKANWEELAKMVEIEEAPSAAVATPTEHAAEEELAEAVSYVPDAEAIPETSGAAPGATPHYAADAAEIERLVREAVDQMMPQIVDRISRTVEIQLRREKE